MHRSTFVSKDLLLALVALPTLAGLGLLGACTAQTDDGRGESVGQTDEALVCRPGTTYRCVGSVCGCDPTTPPPLPPAPVSVSTGYVDPGPIASDATNIYWGTFNGEVLQCAKPGCTNVTTLNASGSNIMTVVTDGANVYWINGNQQIMECAVGGCNGAPTTLANTSYPVGLAVDATNVYWTTSGSQSSLATLMKCSKSGCGGEPTQLTNAASWTPQTAFSSLVVDGSNAYFYADTQYPVHGTAYGGLVSCSLEGCATPTILYQGYERMDFPFTLNQGLVLTNDVLYMKSSSGILACGVNGCGGVPSEFSTSSGGGWLMATDGAGLYWTVESGTQTTVDWCPLSGCSGSPSVVATFPTAAPAVVAGLTMDASNLYFTFNEQTLYEPNGSIERLTK